MMKTVHVRITGKVQGVWFRQSTKQEAETHSVNGWVKNTKDGAVEGVFQGAENDVDGLIRWCHHGPPLSKVEQVIVDEIDDDKTLSKFSIRY